MKRYTIHGVAASQGKELNNQPYTACEDPEGLWVKWEDIKPYLNAIESEKARIKMIDRRIDRIIKREK